MSFGGKKHTPAPERKDVSFEEEQLSTSQEGIPVPVLIGTRKIAVRWISRVYNQKSKEAPGARPSKK